MGVAFLVILSAYGLAALGLVRLVAPRWPGLLPWLLLAQFAFAAGGMVSMFLALAMIGKGGSHIVYCPNLPVGHLLECLPSWEGILLAAIIAALVALAFMVIGTVLIGGVAAAKSLSRRRPFNR